MQALSFSCHSKEMSQTVCKGRCHPDFFLSFKDTSPNKYCPQICQGFFFFCVPLVDSDKFYTLSFDLVEESVQHFWLQLHCTPDCFTLVLDFNYLEIVAGVLPVLLSKTEEYSVKSYLVNLIWKLLRYFCLIPLNFWVLSVFTFSSPNQEARISFLQFLSRALMNHSSSSASCQSNMHAHCPPLQW